MTGAQGDHSGKTSDSPGRVWGVSDMKYPAWRGLGGGRMIWVRGIERAMTVGVRGRLSMRRSLRLGLAIAVLAVSPPFAQARTTLPMPQFRYDTQWLKLPPGLALGEITAVAVDRRDHLWLLHRPRTVKDRPPAEVAAPIVEFDPQGRYLRAFGGPATGYEWPDVEHTLAVTAEGHIWVSGNFRGPNGHGDDMLLEFRRDGRIVRQIGNRGASTGNADRQNFRAAADVYVDNRAHELYVADGYGNQRVIVLDARDGRYLRMWGAFGAPPPAEPPAVPAADPDGARSFNGVHGVEMSRDRLVYVSDRANQRIQLFTPAGKYIKQVAINRGLPSPLTASGITFSKDSKQKYLFVADWGNAMIIVLDRRTLSVLGTIGRAGTAPGEFRGPHLIDTDSKGTIYVAEVQGRRVQRLIPER